jgi:hypothetical protein
MVDYYNDSEIHTFVEKAPHLITTRMERTRKLSKNLLAKFLDGRTVQDLRFSMLGKRGSESPLFVELLTSTMVRFHLRNRNHGAYTTRMHLRRAMAQNSMVENDSVGIAIEAFGRNNGCGDFPATSGLASGHDPRTTFRWPISSRIALFSSRLHWIPELVALNCHPTLLTVTNHVLIFASNLRANMSSPI